jgi:hypothetical protein
MLLLAQEKHKTPFLSTSFQEQMKIRVVHGRALRIHTARDNVSRSA